LKRLYHFFFFLLLCSYGAKAQDLIGKITDQDSAHSPLFMAEVTQMQDGKTIATYKTYFDGTFRIKVKPSQSYDLKVSFPGRSDTIVSISVDKHGTLYTGTLFISLRKDGLRLTGFILDQVQDIPIKDACIILRNVMTRKEDRFTTDVNGSYNLKMDYETNYTLRIDKMSPGILNKYEDTSFNISTIGFNKPLDFRLDIKLGPTNGYIAPRPEYDPHAKPVNRNLKPSLVVLGSKDSAQKRIQDSIVISLNLQLTRKDSAIASIDKQIHAITKTNNEPKVALRDMDADEKKKQDEEAARMAQEVEARKRELAEEQKKKDLEKAEADLKTKQQAEKELQAKLDKELQDTETRKKQQQAQAVANQLKEINAAKAAASQDSLLKVALAKNKEIMARRKHVADSLAQNQKVQVNNDAAPIDKKPIEKNAVTAQAAKADKPKSEQEIQDSLVKNAEATNRETMLKRKHVLDSLINIESQKVQVKTDNRGSDRQARIKDSIKVIQAQLQKRLKAERAQAEQDSLLRVAEAKNREIMARRKYVADSLALIESQRLQAISDAKKLEREKQEYELNEKQARARMQDSIAKQQIVTAEKEKIARELAKAKEDQALDSAAAKAEQDAAVRKAQLEKDLSAMKKAREEAEAKVLAEKREKEANDKAAKKESKRLAKELAEQNKKQKLALEEAKRKTEEQKRLTDAKAESETEQRELEAKRALQEQEKNQLIQQLGKLQKDEQSAVTKDPETKNQDYNPDQALKNEKEKTVTAYQVNILQENKRRADSITKVSHPLVSTGLGIKLINARGYVKNGQTEDPIPNVSINIRRLNSIVSQEVTSDANGKYDIIVDSGYFYLVSFYKDKYEISKQILDLTSYSKTEYTMVIQYLKERDDFDPNAKMPIIQFTKNSSKVPAYAWTDMQSIVKMMKDIPDLRIKLYGLGSVDEDYPMELSVTRARLVADLLLESGIKPSRIRINGIGPYRPRSGCTEGKQCTDTQYQLDRVVMYKVVKE
jgi:outer membrane protein OmpA-like peptidoglycan-associated protein